MLNSAIIMGRLTRDPEVKHTNSGIPVCSFSVAVDRDYVDKSTGERGTDFIKVTAWRNIAELVGKYFSKGKRIVVDGRIQVDSYTDKDGNKRTDTVINAENCYFVDKKVDTSDVSGSRPAAASGTNAAPASEPAACSDDDDLPF